MDENTTIQLLDIFERHVSAAVEEAKAVLAGTSPDSLLPDIAWPEGLAEEIDSMAADTEWTKTGEEAGVTYSWPDGNIDSYDSYVTYCGNSGLFEGVNLALATVEGKEGEMVGFVLGSGRGSRRPLTAWFPADDFDSTGERLSMIRGKGGGNSRKGYGLGEELPPSYNGFTTDVLRDRIAGKWNVKAVVATDDEAGRKAMLDHTAIQARLRGIII